MIRKIAYVSLLSLSMISNAHALYGDDVKSAKTSAYPYVCKLKNDIAVDNTTCSGTLISKNEILTAAHCFGRNGEHRARETEVLCNNETFHVIDATLPDSSNDAFWKRSDKGDVVPQEDHDFAKITLDHDADFEPAVVAKDPSEFFESNAVGLTKPGVTCYMMGYGNSMRRTTLNTNVKGVYGELMRANLSKLRVMLTTMNVISIRPGKIAKPGDIAYLETTADDGDSGGSFFCQAAGGQEKLVGNIVSFLASDPHKTMRRWNTISPVWRLWSPNVDVVPTVENETQASGATPQAGSPATIN